jgi:hypothetical protein
MLQKMAVAIAAASALLAFTTTPAAASVDDFVGMWTNTDTGADNITRIAVTRAGGRGGGIRLQAWGQCHPRDCDWGTVEARPYAPTAGGDTYRDANVLIAQFDTSFSHQTVILRLARDGVRYETFTDFTDRSRRSSYFTQGSLRRLGIVPFPGPGGGGGGPGGGWGGPGGGGGGPGGGGHVSLPPQDCIGFTQATLRVEGSGGSWRIVDGGHSIIAFNSQAAANRALDVIRRYSFTQQCFIVRPNAAMTYWTRGDAIPPNNIAGDDCIRVNPMNVQTQNVGGRWKVVDGSTWLLDFASNRDGAEQARDTIRYYRLAQQCFVGRPGPSMQYWLTE